MIDRQNGPRYVVAIGLVALTLAFQRLVVSRLPGEPPDLLFIIPITLAAYFGGLGPGLLATVLATVGDWYLLMAPVNSFTVDSPASRLEGAMLLVGGTLLSFLVAALQEARRRTERDRVLQGVTLASIGDSVITTDREGRITFMNNEAERLTGWTLAETHHRNLDELLPLSDVASGSSIGWPHRQAMRDAARTSMAGHVMLRRRDGRLVPISDSCAPLRDKDGPILGAVVVFRDATKELEATAAIEERSELQQMLQRVAATAPGVLYAFRERPDGTVHFPYCSAAVSALFNADPVALARDGNGAFARILPEDLVHVLSTTQASKEQLTPWRDEFRVDNLDRGEIWVEGHSMPTREADGSTLWYGFLNDITARKQGEAALRENELRLGAIIGSAMDGIVSVDEHHRITLFNPAAERMFGCPAGQALGATLDRFIPERLRVRHGRDLEQFRNSGSTNRRMGALGLVSGLRADGSEFPIEASISRILVGGKPMFTAILRDVEARTLAEHAIKQSEERFRRLAGSIHEVFWMTDPVTHTVEYISPAYETIWGRSCESLYASPADWINAVHSDDRDRVATAFLTIVSSGTYEEEFRIIRPDGTVRWIRDRGFPVLDDSGRVIGIAGVAEDITGRHGLEAQIRQTQKMESVGLLAGGVAHDFNNFLTVIAGESELLLDQMAPDDPSRAAVQGMHDAGKRAALLTRQLLAFSRQQVLEPKILDLNQVVGDTERMLRRLLGEDILLRAELSAMVPSIKVDPGHLVQVLLNLAVNARDAMPRGGQLIIATGEAQRAPDPLHPQQLRSYVTLRMTDTGVGMGPEVQARLFEPFFTTKSVGKGTGLGLSVVHGIVSQSGGLVDVESTPGAGTTFTLYFPKSEAAGGESAVEMGPVRVRHRGTEELLVVEDEEPVRRLAVRTLRAAGYQVREAADGLKALELLNQPGQPPIDLLVTDLVMPNLSGRELAEEMAQRQPGIRVLYTSGYTDDAVVRHGIQLAEVAFLQKPYTPSELSRKVREVIDR